jgi:hypothetical protein
MSGRPSLRHALVLLGSVAGVAGTGLVWNGVVVQSASVFAVGAVLLVCGLLWCGRELGRSIEAAHAARGHSR